MLYNISVLSFRLLFTDIPVTDLRIKGHFSDARKPESHVSIRPCADLRTKHLHPSFIVHAVPKTPANIFLVLLSCPGSAAQVRIMRKRDEPVFRNGSARRYDQQIPHRSPPVQKMEYPVPDRADPASGHSARIKIKKCAEEISHRLYQIICPEASRKAQGCLHPLLPARKKRHPSACHLCPACLLLVPDRHALKHHLLFRHILRVPEEFFSALFSERREDRAGCKLLLVYAVLNPEPQEIVELIRPAVLSVTFQKSFHTTAVEILFDEPDHHIKIKIRRSVRPESHERRIVIITSGSIPDDIAGLSLISRIISLDHLLNTASFIRLPIKHDISRQIIL